MPAAGTAAILVLGAGTKFGFVLLVPGFAVYLSGLLNLLGGGLP